MGVEGIKEVLDEGNTLISYSISLTGENKPIWVLWSLFRTFAEVLNLPNEGFDVFKGVSDIIRGHKAWECVMNGYVPCYKNPCRWMLKYSSVYKGKGYPKRLFALSILR